MACKSGLITILRGEILKVERRLGRTSLARFDRGGQRDFIARSFLQAFEGISGAEFEESLREWMSRDRPDPRSVQTVLQVCIETGSERYIGALLDSVETRMAEGLSSTDPDSSRALQDAWWADCVLEPFEHCLSRFPRLLRRVQGLTEEARKTQRQEEITS